MTVPPLSAAASVVLSVDGMGGDNAPHAVLEGMALCLQRRPQVRFLLHGDEALLNPLLARTPALAAATTVCHAAESVTPDEKPTRALRRGDTTSMWRTLAAVQNKQAHAAISGGNTGALMALSRYQLNTPAGIDRPAIAALWPTLRGTSIVLDVGANLDADSRRLVEFALMGVEFARVLTGRDRPRVGLLNIGTEALKGHDNIRGAAQILTTLPIQNFEYVGFIEGNAIGKGVADVIVTDGFTGNVALKTAEGTASLVSTFLKNALQSTLLSRLGALMARGALRAFKEAADPRKVNGGVFLGLNGLVTKSHGSSDGRGFASALELTHNLAAAGMSDAVIASLNALANTEATAA